MQLDPLDPEVAADPLRRNGLGAEPLGGMPDLREPD
jgi:hypothetical protein